MKEKDHFYDFCKRMRDPKNEEDALAIGDTLVQWLGLVVILAVLAKLFLATPSLTGLAPIFTTWEIMAALVFLVMVAMAIGTFLWFALRKWK
jgi:hypothetical protein